MRHSPVYRDKLLVIGAGPVGLGMAKALKQQGIAYDQVEASPAIGGNWYNGVFKTTHIISSKKVTEFTDYPMPADYPDFPSAGQVLAYLESYARAFGLLDRIELSRKVVRAEPLPDHAWKVTFEGGETRTYKGVVVCNGHHWHKKMPSYPGTFTGTLMHSKDYTDASLLEGKRALVIGGGNSGCDITCDGGRVGASCDWSLRSGYWFLPKIAFGRPLMELPLWKLPVFLQKPLLKIVVRLVIGDYRRYGLQWPDHKLFERHPTYGSDALALVRQGRVRVRPAIARLDGKTVHFVDGSSGEFDIIVAATGFYNSFPFLPPGLVEVKNDTPQIYGNAFPAGVRNLYIIGAFQPRGGFGQLITPAAALYARLIQMQDELEQPIGTILERFVESAPENLYIDPAGALRDIWLSNRTMPLLKPMSRWITWRQRKAAAREAAAGVATPGASEPTSAAPAPHADNGRPAPAPQKSAA